MYWLCLIDLMSMPQAIPKPLFYNWYTVNWSIRKILLWITVTCFTVTRRIITIIASIRCAITFKIVEPRIHWLSKSVSFHYTFLVVYIFRQFLTISDYERVITINCQTSFSFCTLHQFSIVVIIPWCAFCSKTVTFITFQGTDWRNDILFHFLHKVPNHFLSTYQRLSNTKILRILEFSPCFS